MAVGCLIASLAPSAAALAADAASPAAAAASDTTAAQDGDVDEDDDEDAPRSSASERPRGRIEVKRQNTARATPSESTKTTLRWETYLSGTVASLRLDIPLPDEKTDFGGSPLNPKLGDVKVRARFASVPAWSTRMGGFAEITFPTADPESLGSGKYQVSAAVNAAVPLHFDGPAGLVAWELSGQVQQVVSFAGNASAKDINQTKLEAALRARWGGPYSAKLTFKPVVDWVEDARTGAVLELEGGWRFNAQWSSTLMAGRRLWGEGVPGTYLDRVELSLSYTY